MAIVDEWAHNDLAGGNEHVSCSTVDGHTVDAPLQFSSEKYRQLLSFLG
jgi:hypothetical protein